MTKMVRRRRQMIVRIAFRRTKKEYCRSSNWSTRFNSSIKITQAQSKKTEVEEVVRQLGLDVSSSTLTRMMKSFPEESLTLPMFADCLKRLGLLTDIVKEAIGHMNKTIMRAKELGLEMHSKLSLDAQLTDLFHMQYHYRMVNKAKPRLIPGTTGLRRSVTIRIR